MYLSQLPGYKSAGARADRLEDYWRDYAFLGLYEQLRIAGGRRVQVRQLTLRMFVQLCAYHSPFMVGGVVGPEHVAQILWRLSDEYETRKTDPDARKKYLATIADLPFKSSVRAIKRFVDRMFADRPPSSMSSNGAKSDTSFAASIVHALAKTYGWNDEEILDLAMPRIFQYLRKIRRDADPDLPYFNPLRDRFTKRITDKYLNRNKHGDQS